MVMSALFFGLKVRISKIVHNCENINWDAIENI